MEQWIAAMTRITALVAIALLSTASATSAFAQSFSEPSAFQAANPNRDVLNGGALTPAGRMGLEQPDGAVDTDGARNAHAQIDRPGATACVQRYRSYDPATGSFLGRDGRRHPCR
jgi:hypothetical protein